MAPEIISRKAARAQGLKLYFTGIPCKRGHVSERQVNNLTCRECDRLKCREAYSKRDKVAERERFRRWSHDNREKVNARSRTFSGSSEGKAYKAAWFQANKERIQANRDDSAANVASAKRWAEANPEKAAEYFRINARRRRALKKNSAGTHTAADLAEILNAQGHRCAYCRTDLRRVKKHVDHIVPLVLGGSNGRENLQFTCGHCNQRKGGRDPIVHARSVGLLL